MRALAIVVLVWVGAGCSSDDEPPTAAGVDIITAFHDLGCSDSSRYDDGDRRDVFECDVDGSPVLLHDVSEEHHEQFVEWLEGRYGPDEFSWCDGEPFPDGFRVVDAEAWVVVTATPESAAEVVRRIGGEVQPIPHGGGPPYSYPHPALECED